MRAHRLGHLVDLVDIRNDKGHVHPGWRCPKGGGDKFMRSLDDAQLQIQGFWRAQLDVPITVVLHFEAQQPNVEITGSGEIVGADVREDSAEGHGGGVVRECDA